MFLHPSICIIRGLREHNLLFATASRAPAFALLMFEHRARYVLSVCRCVPHDGFEVTELLYVGAFVHGFAAVGGLGDGGLFVVDADVGTAKESGGILGVGWEGGGGGKC